MKFLGMPAVVVVGGVLLSGSSLAADLGTRYVKAPPSPIEVVATWTGFYIGANIGYGSGRSRTTFDPSPPVVFNAVAPTTLQFDQDGALGGGQIGYNWQASSFVFGLEADIQKSGLTGSTMQSPIIALGGIVRAPGTFISASGKLDWFGTVRARAGVLATPNLLLYVTGGYAYGKIDDRAETNFANGTVYLSDFSSNRSGYTVGAGAEWAFASNWSAKAEYLYLNLGNRSSFAPSITPGFGINYGFSSNYHIGRVGLNYRFGGPVVAKY